MILIARLTHLPDYSRIFLVRSTCCHTIAPLRCPIRALLKSVFYPFRIFSDVIITQFLFEVAEVLIFLQPVASLHPSISKKITKAFTLTQLLYFKKTAALIPTICTSVFVVRVSHNYTYNKTIPPLKTSILFNKIQCYL